MSKKKKSKHQVKLVAKSPQIKNILTKIPEKFKYFQDCVSRVQKSTYMIVRGRKITQNNKEVVKWTSLGTGVIVSPYKMITCSHVINDSKNKLLHEDGDLYCLIRHDDSHNWHMVTFQLKLDKDLFLYPELDLGILYLQKNFYKNEDKVFKLENEFAKISKENYNIGTEIGILGYPLCQLQFQKQDIRYPLIGNVLLRTDKGVINCSYTDQNQKKYYDFTLQFNPGNSGGPIFDANTGKLIGIIQGYKKIITKINPIDVNHNNNGKIEVHKDFDIHYAYYSQGINIGNFTDVFKQHGIL